jgi:branched-chain amino acid transport system ATP-binding protein
MSAGYSQQPVVKDLDLEVFPGEIVALLGANGAGKSTTLAALSGHLPLLGGEVLVNNFVDSSPLHRRTREGLAVIVAEDRVFPALTVAENIRVGRCDAESVLSHFPELKPLLRRPAGLLSGGEQQMLSLGRALSRGPKCLLADELSLGLAPMVVDRFLRELREAADSSGLGILLVEQHVRKALKVSDRAYVLLRGEFALSGTADDVLRDLPSVESAYLS